jgi:hypothetical protein
MDSIEVEVKRAVALCKKMASEIGMRSYLMMYARRTLPAIPPPGVPLILVNKVRKEKKIRPYWDSG